MATHNITTDQELAALKAELAEAHANFDTLLKATNEIAGGIEALAIVIAKDPGPAEALARILVQHAYEICDAYERTTTV